MAAIAAPVLANQVLASASAIFSWAIREELLKDNPARLVERHKTTSRERVSVGCEVAKFWAAFDDAGLLQGTALKMILLTGQRPGEVTHMRREHIADGWWTLPGAPVRCAALARHQERRDASRLAARSVRTCWPSWTDEFAPRVRCSRSAGWTGRCGRSASSLVSNEKATPHDLRRTHGTTIAALGFGRDAMNRVQNHKEGGIASVYDSTTTPTKTSASWKRWQHAS